MMDGYGDRAERLRNKCAIYLMINNILIDFPETGTKSISEANQLDVLLTVLTSQEGKCLGRNYKQLDHRAILF